MKEKHTGRLIGYARVSSNGQELRLQLDALQKAGCSKKNIYTDKMTGSKSARPGLDQCLSHLKPGDTLVVWRLDRLGRSLRHLIDLVDELHRRQVGLKSLNDGGLDTTTANGKLIFNIFASLAEFERQLIQERTKAGLTAARARGRLGGRPSLSLGDPRIQTARKLHADKNMPVGDILKTLQISRPTLYRWLAVQPQPISAS
ncbi:MAG: recombinase family protein [Verrucomicrobia bacterium]|nr:recombinase family protein [Verrucomicrobiota bacterium]